MSIINFIYQNKKYPIDFKLLKNHSGYFLLKKDIEIKEDFHLLVDEFDLQCNLTEDNINEFLQYFKSEHIQLTNINIFQIKYLSRKYEVSSLIKEVDEYIDNNYNSLIEEFLNTHTQNLEQKEQFFSNQDQEELISYHITEYLDDDRLPSFPIDILYRIIGKFLNQSQSNDDENSTKKNKIRNYKTKKKKQKLNRKMSKKSHLFKQPKLINKIKDDDDDKYNEDKNNDKKIVDFLIKCIKYHGNKASILFNLIDFQNDGIEYLIEKINEENDQIDIDIHFLQKNLIRFLCNKNNENKEKDIKNKEEQIKLKEEIESKIEEIQEEECLKNNEIHEMIKEMKNEINKLKNDYEEKIIEIKEEENLRHIKMKEIYDKKIEELQRINEKQKKRNKFK